MSPRPRVPASNSRILVIDISNSFTKFAVAHKGRLGGVRRLPTRELTAAKFSAAIKSLRFDTAVLSSVVPRRSAIVRRAVKTPLHEVSPLSPLGIGIDYPKPATIGADRLANAVACVAMHGAPAIVVDFGTAVTFDVISKNGNYAGGVITAGMNAMTEYLHKQTALLPRIELTEPRCVVGKSTRAAMLSGAVFGYRGLVAEILRKITAETFPGSRPKIVATGGDGAFIAKKMPVFTAIDPLLTLHGLRIVGERVFG